MLLALPGQTPAAPDPASVPVPPQVEMFILSECQRAHDMKDAGLQDCIAGEIAAYRTTITLLSSAASGDGAAARYRTCRASRQTGHFHRLKAACLNASNGTDGR